MKLWAFMAGICSKEKIVPHEVGGIGRPSSFVDPTNPKDAGFAFPGPQACDTVNDGRATINQAPPGLIIFDCFKSLKGVWM